jgi:hypothetical protein
MGIKPFNLRFLNKQAQFTSINKIIHCYKERYIFTYIIVCSSTPRATMRDLNYSKKIAVFFKTTATQNACKSKWGLTAAKHSNT